jgi:hypothetical protein
MRQAFRLAQAYTRGQAIYENSVLKELPLAAGGV